MANTTHPAKKTEGPVVTLSCPRCAGKGGSEFWHPDMGICYLCCGKKHVKVDIARSARHLAYLRAEYKRRVAAMKTLTDPDEIALADENLHYLVEKGMNRAEMHRLALEAFAEVKAA